MSDFYGDGFKFFVGVVEDGEDENSKVKVRVFGIHPFDENDSAQGGIASKSVSKGDLPWASVVFPVNSTSPNHNLHPEDWVYGFFADGESCQQPVVLGLFARSDGSTGSNFLGNGGSSGGTGTGSAGGPGTLNPGSDNPVKFNSSKYYKYIPGDTNQEMAFNLYTTYLNEEHGIPLEKSKQIAAGVVASLRHESGVSLKTSSLGDSGSAWGIAQWRLNRRKGLDEMCGRNSRSLVCQLNFSITELENRGHGVKSENSHSSVLNLLKSSSTAYDAAYNWTFFYEIPSNRESKSKARARTASKFYDRLAPKFKRAEIRRGTGESKTNE